MSENKPYIESHIVLPEITFKVILLAILLACVLAASNAYLALKVGILTSASIPAAILSMGILRFFKDSNILENNLVQTAASAGEAIAGGIVFTVPALIMIHYWTHFAYWENMLIALTGSFLGVFFSIPIRRALMTEPYLRYPEGRAIAEVLQAGDRNHVGIKQMLLGSFVGAMIEFCQTGLKVIASDIQLWFNAGRVVFGFGAGFSAVMIGVGYLVGIEVAASIFLGAVIGWMIGVPSLSEIYHYSFQSNLASDAAQMIWSQKIRYMGIGAMLIAGIWTLLTLFKPFYQSIKTTLARIVSSKNKLSNPIPRTEKDLPLPYVLMGIFLISVVLYFLLQNIFPLAEIGIKPGLNALFIIISILYLIVIGFIFAVITGYFSGLVGVTASPGSAIVIAGLLITAFLLQVLLHTTMPSGLTDNILKAAAAIAIIMGAILTGIACIANDNIQDLKVGHILGATPWKQQIMLLIGALVSSLVIPAVMQVLFNVYGIGDVLPHANMDPTEALPAPPAALMATLAKGVFHGKLPWDMMMIGAGISVLLIVIQYFLQSKKINFSILAVAIGIYLPIDTTTALFIGGLSSYVVKRKLTTLNAESGRIAKQKGLLLACGLVVGASLMDVVLAIPFALGGGPDVMKVNIPHWHLGAEIAGILVALGLFIWLYRTSVKTQA